MATGDDRIWFSVKSNREVLANPSKWIRLTDTDANVVYVVPKDTPSQLINIYNSCLTGKSFPRNNQKFTKSVEKALNLKPYLTGYLPGHRIKRFEQDNHDVVWLQDVNHGQYIKIPSTHEVIENKYVYFDESLITSAVAKADKREKAQLAKAAFIHEKTVSDSEPETQSSKKLPKSIQRQTRERVEAIRRRASLDNSSPETKRAGKKKKPEKKHPLEKSESDSDALHTPVRRSPTPKHRQHFGSSEESPWGGQGSAKTLRTPPRASSSPRARTPSRAPSPASPPPHPRARSEGGSPQSRVSPQRGDIPDNRKIKHKNVAPRPHVNTSSSGTSSGPDDAFPFGPPDPGTATEEERRQAEAEDRRREASEERRQRALSAERRESSEEHRRGLRRAASEERRQRALSAERAESEERRERIRREESAERHRQAAAEARRQRALSDEARASDLAIRLEFEKQEQERQERLEREEAEAEEERDKRSRQRAALRLKAQEDKTERDRVERDRLAAEDRARKQQKTVKDVQDAIAKGKRTSPGKRQTPTPPKGPPQPARGLTAAEMSQLDHLQRELDHVRQKLNDERALATQSALNQADVNAENIRLINEGRVATAKTAPKRDDTRGLPRFNPDKGDEVTSFTTKFKQWLTAGSIPFGRNAQQAFVLALEGEAIKFWKEELKELKVDTKDLWDTVFDKLIMRFNKFGRTKSTVTQKWMTAKPKDYKNLMEYIMNVKRMAEVLGKKDDEVADMIKMKVEPNLWTSIEHKNLEQIINFAIEYAARQENADKAEPEVKASHFMSMAEEQATAAPHHYKRMEDQLDLLMNYVVSNHTKKEETSEPARLQLERAPRDQSRGRSMTRDQSGDRNNQLKQKALETGQNYAFAPFCSICEKKGHNEDICWAIARCQDYLRKKERETKGTWQPPKRNNGNWQGRGAQTNGAQGGGSSRPNQTFSKPRYDKPKPKEFFKIYEDIQDMAANMMTAASELHDSYMKNEEEDEVQTPSNN